jgi:hypothetical protein
VLVRGPRLLLGEYLPDATLLNGLVLTPEEVETVPVDAFVFDRSATLRFGDGGLLAVAEQAGYQVVTFDRLQVWLPPPP